MKNLIGLICILLFATNADAGDEKIIKSSISKVTVYSQGAQIFRKSTYSVSKGVTEVIIEGVSPRIDPKSLQVKATGNVIILDSKYSIFYPKPEELKLEGYRLKSEEVSVIWKILSRISTLRFKRIKTRLMSWWPPKIFWPIMERFVDKER
ncbi:MAG: DUF4140 domain-containing protein [Crocinitomicaceae bacterium]|nr:DUF4140 domain-containing protein [Crocinitomicaceae bacterium]